MHEHHGRFCGVWDDEEDSTSTPPTLLQLRPQRGLERKAGRYSRGDVGTLRFLVDFIAAFAAVVQDKN